MRYNYRYWVIHLDIVIEIEVGINVDIDLPSFPEKYWE